MKIFVITIMIICLFLSIIPVFTDSGKAYGKTMFQMLSDNISDMGKKNPERKQTEWTSIFQKAKRNISTWNKASSEVKSLSLRGNKAELNKRRGL